MQAGLRASVFLQHSMTFGLSLCPPFCLWHPRNLTVSDNSSPLVFWRAFDIQTHSTPKGRVYIEIVQVGQHFTRIHSENLHFRGPKLFHAIIPERSIFKENTKFNLPLRAMVCLVVHIVVCDGGKTDNRHTHRHSLHMGY